MTVAESLRRIRKAHKLTQQDIANVLGVDRTTYTLYETGVTNPPIDALEKLSHMYNATIGYILGKEADNHAERLSKGDFVAEKDVDPVVYLPKDEKKLVISFRVLSEKKKEEILAKMLEELKKG